MEVLTLLGLLGIVLLWALLSTDKRAALMIFWIACVAVAVGVITHIVVFGPGR